MREAVEEALTKDNVVGKLEELKEITSKTRQPIQYQAWRPTGNVDDALAAVDMKVAEAGKEELKILEQQLDAEVEMLELQLEEMASREKKNRAALAKREEQLVQLNNKLEMFVQMEDNLGA